MIESKLCHLMYIPFTGLGIRGGYRGNIWLKNRLRVFKEYVLPSLQNQSNSNFVLWISFREEDEDNQIVQDFIRNLAGIRGLNGVITYHGVCFWDDKYSDEEAEERLRESLKKTLPELKDVVKDADLVLTTIQPSDDMYLSNAVETFQKQALHDSVVKYQRGYIMNYATKEIAEYNPQTHPPFYTITLDRETFLDSDKHYKAIGPYKSHEYVEMLNNTVLEERGFVVGTHGENISTTFNHPYKGRTLTKEEAEEVLIKTGTLFAEPIVIKRRSRLIARKPFNTLPFQEGLRVIYNLLPTKWRIF